MENPGCGSDLDRSRKLLGTRAMIAAARERLDAFFGRGLHSTSVPVMDGPLQPNHLLEQAPIVAMSSDLDNLASLKGDLLFTSGTRLLRLPSGAREPEKMVQAASPISSLAVSAEGAIAIGLDGVGVEIRGGRHNGRRIDELDSQKLICPTALLFFDEDTLIIASGSLKFKAAEWKHDLMSCGSSGSVWRVDLKSGDSVLIAASLAFPYGLARAPGEDVLVSESWRHRVVRFGSQPGGHPV